MNYTGRALGNDTQLSVESEGLRIGQRFIDYADFVSLKPINHRVIIELISGETVEISMLGFSYDGFWEEIMDCYGRRSLESLFVDEQQIMLCEGEYSMPGEAGRGWIALYPDAVCILPQTKNAVRIPLCYAARIWLDGYFLHILMRSGIEYIVGKMGYDTKPFAERAMAACDQTKKQRTSALKQILLNEPFTCKGLFRTRQPEQYWNAEFGRGVCAVELFTGDDAATYLYKFDEPQEVFLAQLEEAMEAAGTHREVIYLSDEQLADKPLYRMSVDRAPCVRFLRARSDGRLIHSANHAARLSEYLS
ncbi:MAG: hypothetical protein IKH67_01275 [Lachnospiraceae bacterium]|nr:hypothetical protein [Lachnospiraceae bacterium]MBR6350134.1 hypothetical protein [Lachnospiraceae bacterium]